MTPLLAARLHFLRSADAAGATAVHFVAVRAGADTWLVAIHDGEPLAPDEVLAELADGAPTLVATARDDGRGAAKAQWAQTAEWRSFGERERRELLRGLGRFLHTLQWTLVASALRAVEPDSLPWDELAREAAVQLGFARTLRGVHGWEVSAQAPRAEPTMKFFVVTDGTAGLRGHRAHGPAPWDFGGVLAVRLADIAQRWTLRGLAHDGDGPDERSTVLVVGAPASGPASFAVRWFDGRALQSPALAHHPIAGETDITLATDASFYLTPGTRSAATIEATDAEETQAARADLNRTRIETRLLPLFSPALDRFAQEAGATALTLQGWRQALAAIAAREPWGGFVCGAYPGETFKTTEMILFSNFLRRLTVADTEAALVCPAPGVLSEPDAPVDPVLPIEPDIPIDSEALAEPVALGKPVLAPQLILLRAGEQAGEKGPHPGGDSLTAQLPTRAVGVLRDILHWWRTRGIDLAERYERTVFGGRLTLVEVGLARDSAARRDWLRLWAAALISPRAAPLGEADTWLDLLAEPPPPEPEWPVRFALVMDALLDDEAASRWSEHGGALCAFGRWLPDTVLEALSRLHSDPPESGPLHSDPPESTAPHSRGDLLSPAATVFITRELLRRGFSANPRRHPDAFVVSPFLRETLESLGAVGFGHGPAQDSATAHRFLSRALGADATFDGAFDVPFHCLEHDTEALTELLSL